MPRPLPENSEWLTRKVLIDKLLMGSGWRVAPHHVGESLSAIDCCALEEFPTATEPADHLVLAKAFHGEHVPTEAALARREGRSDKLATPILDRTVQEIHCASRHRRKRLVRARTKNDAAAG